MNINDWAKKICSSGRLEDKLFFPHQIIYNDYNAERILIPTRDEPIRFSNEKQKFPKNFNLEKNKAIAFHFFANHELLAIEMMAASLLLFPDNNPEMIQFKKGVVKTIKDEQKHFKLYQDRIEELGFFFGSFPLNDFFWRQMEQIETPEQYLSTVAITFEGANLDFAHYYWMKFKEMNDLKSAEIMKEVFLDEISHVAFGQAFLNKWREEETLWNYYLQNLPFPMTPARAKGISFFKESRIKAGLDTDFVDQLEGYRDEFKVTQRKK